MANSKAGKMSVVGRFLVVVLPVIVVILSGIGVGAFLLLRTTVFDANYEQGRAVLFNANLGMDLWTKDQIGVMDSISRNEAVAGILDPETDAERAERALAEVLERYRSFSYIAIIEDAVPTASAGLDGAAIPEGLLTAADAEVQGGAASFVGAVYAGAGAEPLLPVAVPIQTGNAAAGTLLVGLRINDLTEGFVAQETIGESAYLFVIDDAGEMIAHPNPSLVATEEGRETATLWYESALAGTAQFTSEFGGAINLYVFEPFTPPAVVSERSWFVYYRRGMEESLTAVRSLIIEFAIAIVVVSTLVAGLLLLVSRRVVSIPLRLVREQLGTIADGGGDLRQRMEIQREDEIGEIAQTFNRFVETLGGIVSRIQATVRLNMEVRDGLSSSSTQTSASVNEIIRNIESIESVMQKLDGEVTTASSSTEEIQRNIDLLAREATNQSTAVAESTASVEEMIASLKSVAGITEQRSAVASRLVNAAEEGGQLLETTNETIAQVTQSIGSITEMTGTIEAIAGQTNLLSMNAAIEAAHAGDAGKGFAVVAEEIRKLAETASTSSKEIASNVREIVSKIEKSATDTKELQVKLTEIIGQIRQMGEAFAEIGGSTAEMSSGSDEVLSAMKSLNDISAQISTAAEEMRIGASQTNQNMSNATELAGTAHSAVQQITIGSREILDAMTKLLELTQELDGRTGELETEIGQFEV